MDFPKLISFCSATSKTKHKVRKHAVAKYGIYIFAHIFFFFPFYYPFFVEVRLIEGHIYLRLCRRCSGWDA